MMRLIQQITFDAKDDAEAMRLARSRLGDDAVVISVIPVKRGGFSRIRRLPNFCYPLESRNPVL